ncbi:SGNH/GDSL hydrolase family protein [Flavihumibacter sp. R14]|nr:SGNH/GDSL hydrolase family protein [Flavihumibacter soli]
MKKLLTLNLIFTVAFAYGQTNLPNGSRTLSAESLPASGRGGSTPAAAMAVIPNAANVIMSGDSYTVGGAGPTSINNSHPHILKSRHNFSLNNLAQNATGVFQAVKNLYANTPGIPTADAFFFMSGFNDLRRGGGGSPTLEKIKGAARVYLANAFAKSVTIANDAAVTKSGTWTTTSTATFPAKAIQQYTNSIVYSSVVGSTLTYTFTGDNMFVSILGVDGNTGFTGGTVTITVDGVLKETFITQGKSDGFKDAFGSTNQFSPNGVYIKGLSGGSHTCVLAVSELPAGGTVYVDYFGTLETPIKSKPVLVGNYPYMTTVAYSLAPPYNNASNIVMDAGNAALESVINEFPYYPVYLADVNAVFNTAIHIAGDRIHPNDAGAMVIADAFSALITPSVTTSKKGPK